MACDEMRPTVREVSKQYEGTIKFVVINMGTTRGEQQAEELHAHEHPVLVFQDHNGTERLRRYGLQDKDRIQQGFAMLADSP